MSSKPIISVIIPTYNRANDLKRALRSVQLQTFGNWEALIIDNHSHDHTAQVVSDFNDSRMKLLKVHNKGVIAVSRNLGIREASGEYIAFLDSDDWWKPKKLMLSLNAINTGADIVYHDLLIATKYNQRLFCRKLSTSDIRRPVFNNLLINGNCISNSSVVVKKNILTSIKGISEDHDLIAAEDYDCWLRIAKVTDKFTRLPYALGYYWSGGGNTSNPELTIASVDAIISRYLDNKSIFRYGLPNWIHYSKGRANYLLRNFELAKKHLSKIRWIDTPLEMYLKTQWMLQLIKLANEDKS